MAEAGRPGVGASFGASDDMIGSLATRVRELALRVAQLEGELEAARRRIAVYEDFDATVQDSLSAALRAANQIRERAHVTAEALAQEARAKRPATTEELEAQRLERDVLRKAIDEAAARPPTRAETFGAQPAIPIADMRSAATEALRGVFKELVAEIRATSVAPVAPQPVAQTIAQAPAAVPSRPDNSPPPVAAPVAAPMSAAQRPAAPTPPPAQMTAPVAAPVAPQPAAAPPAPRPLAPAPRPSLVEDEDVPADPRAALIPQAQPPAPAAPAPAPAAAPAPAPEAAAPVRPAAPAEPVGEVQLVLSPIASFPRLVELERRLQGMPAVRTVYARDFRNGVATLAIGLRQPMTVQDFATAVTSLEYPRLRVLSTTGYVLELRIDSEASIA